MEVSFVCFYTASIVYAPSLLTEQVVPSGDIQHWQLYGNECCRMQFDNAWAKIQLIAMVNIC
jgi:hypothetical protein